MCAEDRNISRNSISESLFLFRNFGMHFDTFVRMQLYDFEERRNKKKTLNLSVIDNDNKNYQRT